MARRDEVLMRDSSDAMLGGVCAGIATYFDVDTTLVRALFVASVLFSGFGLLLYVLLWVLLDDAPPPPPSLPPPPTSTDELVDTVEETAEDTVEETAEKAVEETAEDTVAETAEETVDQAVPLTRE